MNEKKTRRRGHEIDRDLLLEAGLLEADLEGMSKGELAELVRMVTELVETGESKTAKAMVQADYKWEPCSMAQFLNDEYYLGSMTGDLFPKWHTALIDIFDGDTPPCEVLLGGALGTGKTTVAALGMLYDLYRVGCLKNPHEFFGLMRGANIAFALYSVSKEQAADSAFGKMMTWVDGSPYFKERMPKVGKHTTKAKFQDSPTMVIVGSKTIHAIGKDVFAFCLDEANFLASKSGQEDTGLAYDIYNNAKDRLKSRFLDNQGEVPGKVWLISSKRTHVSFLEAHIKTSKEDIDTGRTKLYQYSQWEVRDPAKYKKPKFQVELGDRIHPARILEKGEDPRQGAECITVPGEYLDNFEKDMDGALRNIAGVSTDSICPLLQDKSCLYSCIAKDIHGKPRLFHPFSMTELNTSTADEIQIADYFDPSVMFQVRMSSYVPRYCPDAPRYVHVDIAFTEDSMGIACVHQSGMRSVKRARADGTYYDERVPELTVDFMVRINPPKHGEIDLAKMRAFIISLRDLGLPIKQVSFDGYNSKDSAQLLRKLDFDSVVFSIDRTDEAYLTLRQALMEGRITYYEYPAFIREMSELERNIEKAKVDHPKISPSTGGRGGKDVADAVCGASFACMNDLNAGAIGGDGNEHNVDRKLKLPGGHTINWENLEREAGL
jgi:hypothetical protein